MKITKLGLAMEAFGLTITGVGIGELDRWLLIPGLIIMALGRGLKEYGKD